ncbi:MAG: hypothetical protein ACOYJX_01450 [Acutalibacteraceae bacterium]|jgi:hypothetical protein
MKKVLSILLAAVMVISMSFATFAAFDFEAFLAELLEEGANVVEMIDGLTEEEAKQLLEDAVAKLSEVDIEALINEFDPDDVPAFVDDLLDQVSAELGVDVDEIKDKLGESEIFNWFAKLYMPAIPETTEAPTEAPTVPDTGSAAGGLAVFAVMSVAAAAAFVFSKKD